MTKVVCSEKIDITIINDNMIILVSDLLPFVTDKEYSGFPPLSKDIYIWCLKNKCRYAKVTYIDENKKGMYKNRIYPEWALMFKSVEACDRFRDHWIQCIISLNNDYFEYEFAEDHNPWSWDLEFSKEANEWVRENKIKIIKKDHQWFRFKTPEQAMAFKLRWM